MLLNTCTTPAHTYIEKINLKYRVFDFAPLRRRKKQIMHFYLLEITKSFLLSPDHGEPHIDIWLPYFRTILEKGYVRYIGRDMIEFDNRKGFLLAKINMKTQPLQYNYFHVMKNFFTSRLPPLYKKRPGTFFHTI